MGAYVLNDKTSHVELFRARFVVIATGGASKAGKGQTVVGMAIMLKGENSKLVVDRVKREISEIQKTLPAGVKINPFYDRTDLIQSCIRTVSRALAQGGFFVILVLFLLF